MEGPDEVFESVGGVDGACVADDGLASRLVFSTKVASPFKC